MTETSRRRFLAGSALTGAGFLAALATPLRSRAFSLEPADHDTATIYLDACSTNSVHQELIAEVLARLDGALPPEDVKAALADLSCPYCGCQLG